MSVYIRIREKNAMSAGFTLIELVIIIVVLGILAAVAIPTYFSISKEAQESAARGFGATLKEAQSIYLSRIVLEGTDRNPPVQRFSDFVAMSEGASGRNTVKINSSIRNLLSDPSADLFSDNGTTITLNLKGGAVAVYRIDPSTGDISENYTGF